MSLANYFPDLIQQLPRFEGPFEAFQLSAQDCDVLLSSYPAGTVIPPHSHETENVGVITQGVLLLTMGGKTAIVCTGEWYHVPAGEEHAAEFSEDTAGIEFWFKAATSSS